MTNATGQSSRRPTILTMSPEEFAKWRLGARLKTAQKQPKKKREYRARTLDKKRKGK